MAAIDYYWHRDSTGEPVLLEGERTYLWLEGITLSEKRGAFKNGSLMITTHHIFWSDPKDKSKPTVKIPLAYIGERKSAGGWLTSEKLDITLQGTSSHPGYFIHLHHNILKIPVPPVPSYPAEFRVEFGSGDRDKFTAKLNEALAAKYWEKFAAKKEEVKMIDTKVQGIEGIRKAIKGTTSQMASVISNSFSGMDSLRDSAKKLVAIAEKIKSKLTLTEGGAMSQEMQELQAVMFDIGIGTPVTKEAAGKEYYAKLAMQFAAFVQEALEKSGGIMTVIDAYCLYNRARGTDSVSPEDIFIAANMFPKLGIKVGFKQLKSKVWIFQSNKFDEKTQIDTIASLLKENGPLSAEQIANKLSANSFIIKENLQLAEENGAICRDDSVEGLLYCENLILAYMSKH